MSKQELMTVANRLADLCRSGQEATGLAELYDPEVVSVEAAAMPGQDSAEIRGVEGVRQKHAWWYGAFEVHDAGVEGPFPHGDDRFALIFDIDATNRATAERTRMKEVAVYHVRDGRIVREEFFYA